MSRYWIGTSGYNYREWKGTFYPEDLSEKAMLAFYGERLASVEINYTFYRMPNVRTLQGWAKETPDDFRFSLKAPRRITHDYRLRDAGDALVYFCDAAKVLKGKLGVLLFQLPPFLKRDVARLEDFLHQLPPGFRAAFEFRNATWLVDEVFDCLKRFEVALCLSEQDERETPFESTAPFGYLRLRRSDYTDAELAAWAQRLSDRDGTWEETYVYFKHEAEGRGPVLAHRFDALLRGEQAEVAASDSVPA